MSAYEDALAILKKSPIEPEVLPETQTDDLVKQIEAEMQSLSAGEPISGLARQR
jgi:hypothetical protein